jgi:ABC-type nitrate/sulfonate/bicarbonate transport system permease component
MADHDRHRDRGRRDDRPAVASAIRRSANGASVAFKRIAPPVVTLALGLVLWEAFVVAFDVPSVVLPPPGVVARTAVATHRLLLTETAVTAATAALGLLAGTAVGLTLAFAMTVSRSAAKALLPYVVALRIAPLIAVAPLVFLWFGRGVPARALLVATLTTFPMTVATLDGLRSMPERYLDLGRSVAAPPRAVFFRIRVPAAAPSVFAGLKIAATLAVIGAVVAEFVTLRAGLGYRVFTAATNLRTSEAYAALVALAALGLGFYLVPVALKGALTRR